MTARRMTKARKLRIWHTHNGVCHLCGLAIKHGEQWEAEHIIALGCGGEDTDANLAPAHIDCHRPKTKGDVRVAAKLKRVEARHIGAHMPKASIPNRGWPKRFREPRDKPPPLSPRALWITLDNKQGND